MNVERKWWKESVMYQIYPRSFKDSNNDGIGDIRGIIGKLDYLQELGVDIIWLGPVYPSPNDDNGYDISDYRDIHPEFGTMEDFDVLLAAVHKRGIKLIMDLVVNHTSDEHPWFLEAKKSKDNPYRDYYIWRAGQHGRPPNNWISFFKGSAWEKTSETGEYYLHLFTRKQPDLNWENPIVRREVYDIMKFWLDKGIDGFRMDVISLISKPHDFGDGPIENFKELVETKYANGPMIHEYLREMYDEVLSHYDIMTVGEGPGITKEIANDYIGSERRELNMIFQLDLMFLDFGPGGKTQYRKFERKEVKQVLMEWDKAIGERGWNNIFLDNHDFPRLVSRLGNDKEYRVKSAQLFAILLLTFRGTPCIYQGSEIGMTNVKFDHLQDYRDIETFNIYKEVVEGGLMSRDDFFHLIHVMGRDNARTPLQWDNTPNGGFTAGVPWIKVNPNYKEINIEQDRRAQDSIFQFYKQLIQFRKHHDVLVYGNLQEHFHEHSFIFGYSRDDGNVQFLILLNMSEEQISLTLPEAFKKVTTAISNYRHSAIFDDIIEVKPWEGLILKPV